MRILPIAVTNLVGIHVAHRLLVRGVEVVGIHNLNDYYNVDSKEERLKQLTPFLHSGFVKLDMAV
jgi:UDP-glucuronate 4-epimerase